MKKDKLAATVLQAVMGIVLIIFGLLLNRGEQKNAALCLLMIPGIVIMISMIFNFFKYKSQYFFPIATCSLCLLGDIVVFVMFHLKLTWLVFLGVGGTIAITGLICTLFHLLHGEIIK
ncbi:MAG: hypothetical protein IIY57_00175 [Erysipelotrichaceae bacterium]|nr:hypothetical protein [Erysipelotrichaceae bacterium]